MKKQYLISVNASFWPFYFPEWESWPVDKQQSESMAFLSKVSTALDSGKNVIIPDHEYITIHEITDTSRFIVTGTPRYFSHILHDHWKPKNKLAAKIKELVRSSQHRILNNLQEVTEYVSHLKLETVKLHESHPTAKMIVPHVTDHRDIIMMYWPGIVHLQIIQEKCSQN